MLKIIYRSKSIAPAMPGLKQLSVFYHRKKLFAKFGKSKRNDRNYYRKKEICFTS